MLKTTSIFKYRAYNTQSLEMLINDELWFAKPETLNDPFECRIDIELIRESIKQSYKLDQNTTNTLTDFTYSNLREFGICSFSRTKKNQLMWAHYADEHRGFCLGFKESALLEEPAITSKNVNYSTAPPLCKVISNVFLNEDKKLEILLNDYELNKLMTEKYSKWRYEQETRLILTKSKALKFNPQSLISITFGLNMPERHKTTLVRLVQDSGRYSHIRWFQATRKTDKYGLDFKRVKPEQILFPTNK